MYCNVEMEKKCVQQEERHAEQHRRLHISQSSAQSTTLYNYSGYLSVQVCMPPPPLLPLLQPQPLLLPLPLQSQVSPPLQHPGIPLNALLQVPVVDFVQQ